MEGLGTALSSRARPALPPGAAPSLLTCCPSASLPAVSIPVVHLHLDGPGRQRARGGMDLTQHLRGLSTGPFSCSWARGGEAHGGDKGPILQPQVSGTQAAPKLHRDFPEFQARCREATSDSSSLRLLLGHPKGSIGLSMKPYSESIGVGLS